MGVTPIYMRGRYTYPNVWPVHLTLRVHVITLCTNFLGIFVAFARQSE